MKESVGLYGVFSHGNMWTFQKPGVQPVVRTGVAVGVGVLGDVGVSVGVGVALGVFVAVGVRVGVLVGVGVRVGHRGVGVGV